MRVVWLDGALVDPDEAVLSLDDPGVRWGEGLFETMRAEGGRVALLERHLDRLLASGATLGLAPMPDRGRMRAAVAAALSASAPGSRRLRLTATPRPTLLVESTAECDWSREPPMATAATIAGAWHPSDRMAEHKCLSYAGHRWSQRRARAAGADHALLLDSEGRLGEAALASVFCAVGGRVVSAPVHGLLPGVARALVVEGLGVEIEALEAAAWRSAHEIVLTNAVQGAIAIVAVDGAPVGEGAVGPLAQRIGNLLRTALS